METKLHKNLWKYRYKFLIGILLIVGFNSLQIQIPKLQGNVIDLLTENSMDKKALLCYIGIILLLAVGAFILTFISQVIILGITIRFDYDLRGKLFKHILDLSVNYLSKTGAGEIMALSTNDLRMLRMTLGRGFNMVVSLVILFVLASYQISHVNLKLMLMVMIPFPLTILVILWFGPIIRRKHILMRESFSELTSLTQENISAVQVIKAFSREKNEIRRFTEKNKKNFQTHLSLIKIGSTFHPLIYLVSTLSLVILMFYGGDMVIDEKITLGEFIACNTYVIMLIHPIAMFGMVVDMTQQSRASWKRIAAFLDVTPEIVDKVNEEEFRRTCNDTELFQGDIQFKNLSFKYDEAIQPALENITLTIKHGTSIGIVGKIGSGKTTLVNLIMRLYETDKKDDLIINGYCIKDIPRSILRESIGYVPQDDFLFSDTINNNIDFNSTRQGIEKVKEAAEASQIHETILEFVEGYETKLGERGVNISGGQKQRLSIARAIIRDASLIIMDDCLSAVDTHTEEKIIRGLQEYTKTKTSIIIGHRISTVQHCDQIIVLEHGRIAEQGSHEELLKYNGLYNEIFEQQRLEEAIENN